MAGRKAISKKLRFEVFKRDSFTCQYCGKSAPDIILHVDHINPVKNCGKNDILNLITSCVDCNLGKGARDLSDNSTLAKQQKQLQEINERREQMTLMLKWRDEMGNLKAQQVQAIIDAFNHGTGYVVNDTGRVKVQKWVNQYTLQEILEAVELSKDNYLVYQNGGYTHASIDKALSYVPRICACRRIEKDNPSIKQLNYIKGIVRNRCGYFNPGVCTDILRSAYDAGVNIEVMMSTAKRTPNWSTWTDEMQELIDAQRG